MLTTETYRTRTLVRDASSASEFPVAVRAGDYVFAPGIFTGEEIRSGLGRWSQKSKADAVYAYARQILDACGCPSSGILHLTQYMSDQGMVPASFAGRSALFGSGLPCTTAIGVCDVGSPDAGIQLDIIAYAGDASALERKRAPDVLWFSESIGVGSTVYFAGVTADDQMVKVQTERWQWSPVREHTTWLLESRLGPRFKAENCSEEDIVLLHCHVREPAGQVAPVSELLRERFGDRMPVVLMSPATHLHWQRGRIELTPVAIRSHGSGGSQSPVVMSKAEGPFGGPAAARVGDFVHIGTVVASPDAIEASERRTHFHSPASIETADIVKQIEAIADEFASSLADLVMVRCSLSDMDAAPGVADVLRRTVGTSVAVSIVGCREAAGWLPGSGLSIDAVLYRPLEK